MMDTVVAPVAQSTVSAQIFRAYDIRGVVEEDFGPEVVHHIGQAFGTMARQANIHKVVVGRDGRLSGPKLLTALIDGLMSTGVQVINIGLVPTPLLYFATHHFETGTGIMLTGSHNPPNYNGTKMMLGGRTLSGPDIQQLRQLIATQDYVTGTGTVECADVKRAYVRRVASDIQLKRPLRVVVDCGNGAAGVVVPDCLNAIGAEVVPLYCEVDGHFPNHHPDPSNPKNLAALIQKVADTGADCGLAFDGDGDRLGLVSEKGDIIWADRQMMLLAQDVLSRHPDAEIVYDVKCTNLLADVIRQSGGKPVMTKTGHSLIKATMQKTGALLGGEMSGHFFFKERWYGFDDGGYAACRLLEVLAQQMLSVSALFEALPDAVNTPEIQVPLADDLKFDFVARLIEEGHFPEGEKITIDGLRVEFKDGWGLVRVSNTTPNLICRFEANCVEALNALKKLFSAQMLAVKPDLAIPF